MKILNVIALLIAAMVTSPAFSNDADIFREMVTLSQANEQAQAQENVDWYDVSTKVAAAGCTEQMAAANRAFYYTDSTEHRNEQYQKLVDCLKK